MKIDIHAHTKKCKGGDSEHRNIDADKFDEIIRLTDVKILAITNHNHFDLSQYQQIKDKVEDVCQIWPGVELDIIEDGRRAHLIVLVNPKNVVKFNKTVQTLLIGKTADNFNISIEETVNNFDSLDALFIAHYYGKKPNLTDEDLVKLIGLVSHKKRVIKEASNSISSGIYISHGHSSIYGSDVQNWNDYHDISKSLPDLRLPVQSFDQFCFLLEKDIATINTILAKKSKQNIELFPFQSDPSEKVNINVYNDINIIFGSKGTGKSDILHALSKHYNDLGIKNKVYQSSAQTLEVSYDLKGNLFDANLSEFGIDDCFQEINNIRNSSEKNVTSLSSYYRYFAIEQTNKVARKLKIQDFTPLDEPSSIRDFKDISSSLEYFNKFIYNIDSDDLILGIIGDGLYKELKEVIQKILIKLKTESEKRIFDLHSITLFNQIINVFVEEIAKKTGLPQKPVSTGFSQYASNRIRIEKDLKKVLDNISQSIEPKIEFVGNLGEKGELFCQTNLVIQNGNFIDVDYKPVKNATKNPQRYFASILEEIEKHLYVYSLFEKITELKVVEGSENISNLSDLLIFHRHFTVNGRKYKPSTGESSMVLLQNELIEDKEIYIIDEPEKSLGNDYISNVIVPMLKEKAQASKRVIIATHDANIAVRTLPYNSIYREHDINGYFTFQGNPFSNNLICTEVSKTDLDWKEYSMKTLEGGKEAFGERGKIYGNS